MKTCDFQNLGGGRINYPGQLAPLDLRNDKLTENFMYMATPVFMKLSLKNLTYVCIHADVEKFSGYNKPSQNYRGEGVGGGEGDKISKIPGGCKINCPHP